MNPIAGRLANWYRALTKDGTKYGRPDGFSRLGELVDSRDMTAPVIVETGTIRNDAAGYREGDGWSTLFFRGLVDRLGGELHSVDIDPDAVAVSKKVVLTRFGDLARTFHHAADSVAFLRNFEKTIDILYLDSMNYTGDDTSARHQLAEIQACIDKISPQGIIMVDDILETIDHGKAALSIPFMKARGWTDVQLIPVAARRQRDWFQAIVTRPSP